LALPLYQNKGNKQGYDSLTFSTLLKKQQYGLKTNLNNGALPKL
jgi:hypothetical protein